MDAVESADQSVAKSLREGEVEAWVERQKAKLIEAVRQGPVLVN